MIQANELRIGNLLNHNNGHIVGTFKVNEVHILDIIENNEYGEQYEPIPLTEEILLKCGFTHQFKQCKGQDFFSLKLDDKYQIYVNLNSGMFSINKQHLGIGFVVSIKYLHELQNLFFALTKTELEVKL
jgi:hypothetical protein